MLSKLKSLYAKMDLVHWILLAALVCTAESKEILNLVGLVDPSATAIVQKAMIAIVGLAALIKQVKAGAGAAAGGQAGYSRVETLAFVVILGVCAAFLPAAHCNSQQVLSTVPADVNLGLCVATIVENDLAVNDSWEQIVADELNPTTGCPGDAVQVVNEIDAQVLAQAAKSTITLDQAQAALVTIHTTAKVSPPAILIVNPKTSSSKVGHTR